MPVVPTLESPSVQQEPLPGRAYPRVDTDVSPADFGAGLAQGLGEVGTEGAQLEADLKRQNDHARVVDANTQLEAAKNQMLFGQVQPDGTRVGGAFSLHGVDAINMPASIEPHFNQMAQQIASTLTPDQQRSFADAVAHHRDDLNLQLNRHEYDESNQLAATVYENATRGAVTSAALGWRDPTLIAKSRLDLKGLVSLQGDREGWTPDIQGQVLSGQLALLHQGVVQQMLADGSPADAQRYLSEVPRGELPPAAQEALQQKVKVAVADNVSGSILKAYRDQGPVAGVKAFASIDARTDLDDQTKDQVRSDVQKGLGLWHDEARQKYSDALETLEQRIASGKADMADRSSIWTMYRAGALGPSEAGSAIGRLEKSQQKQVDTDAYAHAIDTAYQNGQPLDPKDKDIKDGVADLFTQYVTKANVKPGSTEWINRGADIAAKTGVTPQPVIDWARTQLVSGLPQDAARAAQALQRQQDANPVGLAYATDDKTKALVKMINDATTAGTDPTIAVENARNILKLPDADKERLDQIWQKTNSGANATAVSALSSKLKSLPGYDAGWFSSNPVVPPQMVGQFQELQHDYFKLTNGNLSQANDLAFNDLKNTWGISQANGKRELMQFAPEAMHPGLTTEALREDMQSSAKGHTPDPSKVRLLVTPETYDSNGTRFALGAPDKFGAYSALTDEKGRVLPYQIPDFTDTVKAAQAKAADAGMARLKAKQGAARESEQALMDSIDQAQELRQRFGRVDIQ